MSLSLELLMLCRLCSFSQMMACMYCYATRISQELEITVSSGNSNLLLLRPRLLATSNSNCPCLTTHLSMESQSSTGKHMTSCNICCPQKDTKKQRQMQHAVSNTCPPAMIETTDKVKSENDSHSFETVQLQGKCLTGMCNVQLTHASTLYT